MKLSNEINQLLVELVNLESIDNSNLLDGNVGMLCQNLIEIYGRTTNSKTQDLIIKIIDKSGYSLFGSPSEQIGQSLDFTNSDKAEKAVSNARSSADEFFISEDDFMSLIPVNGYFH